MAILDLAALKALRNLPMVAMARRSAEGRSSSRLFAPAALMILPATMVAMS
jgi:hypothetical protein